MSQQLVEKYAQGAVLLTEAIRGLSSEDFHKTPIPNTWSIGQIALHLMDADLIGTDRMKRIIAEENPLLLGYNETLFAQKLFYDKLDPFAAADIFKKNRELFAITLRNLPDAAFARTGVHNERGKITLVQFVSGYSDHLHHHLSFITKKRALLGK